jgi:outer membrane protein assembly factor BamB
MKVKLTTLTIILIIAAALLSSCSGGGATSASSWPGVTASEDTAYLAYNQHVYAIDLSSGREKWRFPEKASSQVSFFAAPILTADGQLLVGGYNKVLYSLNPETGKENWSFTESSNRFIASPLVTEQGIFAPTGGDTLYALDTKGNLRWAYKTNGAQWAQPVSNTPCSCIYLTSMDHSIYAIDAQSGELEWKTVDLGGSVVGTPAFSPDGVLYAGTFAGEMVAIKSDNGDILWRTKTDGWVWGGPVLKDGTLYFGDLKGFLYAIEASSGNVVWKFQPDGPISESPLVIDDMLYISVESGKVIASDLQGNLRTSWPKAEIGGKIYTSPVKAGDLILIAPIGKPELLFALDMDGNQRWAFTPEKK